MDHKNTLIIFEIDDIFPIQNDSALTRRHMAPIEFNIDRAVEKYPIKPDYELQSSGFCSGPTWEFDGDGESPTLIAQLYN